MPAPSSALRLFALLLGLCGGLTSAQAAPSLAVSSPAASSSKAVVLTIDGAIGPATADYVIRGIREAAQDDAGAIVLTLDTPGGLDTSMRAIIRAILDSAVPVLAYVAPSGARAASAGTYILMSSPVAAMAPGTNLGAATPIRLGGLGPEPAKNGAKGTPGLEEKMVNDAVAYIRGLAELRGRNADWAEKAVRQAASLSAREALSNHVVDLIADSVPDLLAQADGRVVTLRGHAVTLHTKGLAIEREEPGWRAQVLGMLTDPNITYILLMLGLYGLFFELASPGYAFPGVIGAIFLLLALAGLSALPINYAGLTLILLGIAFMVAETFVPSFGALGLGGVAAFVIGSLMLFDTGAPGIHLAWQLVASFSLASAAFFLFVVAMAVQARRRPRVNAVEGLVGRQGRVVRWEASGGHVQVAGEMWSARAPHPLHRNQMVRVRAVQGLILDVEPYELASPPTPGKE